MWCNAESVTQYFSPWHGSSPIASFLPSFFLGPQSLDHSDALTKGHQGRLWSWPSFFLGLKLVKPVFLGFQSLEHSDAHTEGHQGRLWSWLVDQCHLLRRKIEEMQVRSCLPGRGALWYGFCFQANLL